MLHRHLFASFLAAIVAASLAQAELSQGAQLYADDEWEECIAHYERTLAENPRDEEALFLTAKSFLHLEEFDASVPYFDRLAQAVPDSADYWMWLGRAQGLSASRATMFAARRYVGEMKKSLAKALELDADHLETRIALTQFYAEAPFVVGGSMRKCRKEAERIAELDDLYGDFAWGLYHYFDGDEEEALTRLKSACDGGIGTGMAYVFLGKTYAALGKRTLAIEALNQVFEHEIGASFAREELALLGE